MNNHSTGCPRLAIDNVCQLFFFSLNDSTGFVLKLFLRTLDNPLEPMGIIPFPIHSPSVVQHHESVPQVEMQSAV
jgi:hypothetical protein